MTWTRICPVEAVGADEAVPALVGGSQVAVVRTAADEVFAVDQRDPYSGAQVMARGIIGTRSGEPCLVSPMYKQVFDLRTGTCLDAAGEEERPLGTWEVEVQDGWIVVGARRGDGAAPATGAAQTPAGPAAAEA